MKLILLMLLVTIFSASCTQKKEEKAPADFAPASVVLGKPAFQFDPTQAVSLNIAKADPISGETWSARVAKTSAAADPATIWEIASYSGESQLSDRLANKNWILHFLQNLTTYRPDLILQDLDTEESRGHYGFSPPRYSVEWRIENPETKKTATYDLRVGAPVDFEKAPDGESYTIFPMFNPKFHDQIFEGGGAALVMLSYLKTFSNLRLETLSTVESPDVTALDCKGTSGKSLHFKFDGKKWTGKDMSAELAFITHLRIEKFLDKAPPEQTVVPVITITLKDRYNHLSTLTIDNNDVAQNTDRGKAMFQMYPGSLLKLKALLGV